MSKRVAILVAGSGHRDGTEIHEATCTLLALDRAGASYTGFSPDNNQPQVINHIDGTPMEGARNMMVEAARIMRGNIKPVTELKVEDFDALILPGGFGAAMNLCNYAVAGRDCEIDSDVKNIIQNFAKAGKPIGAICIAPVTLAKALEDTGIKATITLGNDPKVAADVESYGMTHKECASNDAVVDKENKIVTTPAYMLAQKISEVESGVSKLVAAIIEMA
jgi:enhancing lycopene biosynthesis protein 2